MTWHEILNIVLLNIKYILKITAVATIILVVILLAIYPRTYKAMVVVLPPEKNSSMGGLSSLLSGNDYTSFLTNGVTNTNSQLYIEILKSRSASVYVLNKLNLQNEYDKKDIYNAAKKLSDDLEIDISKEGIIRLSVDVKTNLFPLIFDDIEYRKKLSANLSNTFIEALDKINREKLVSKSRRARIFIEDQLRQTKMKLDSVETSLTEFQEKYKTISLPDQIKSAIETAALLKTEITKTEIDLGLIKTDAGESSRLYNSLNQKLQELKEQYSKFETGSEDYFLAFKDVPELGKRLSVLMREVKIQNEVYMLLQQQYFKERIQENRDLPTIEVLDEAVPPNTKDSPRTLSSTIFGMIFLFLLTSFVFVYTEKKKRLKQYTNVN